MRSVRAGYVMMGLVVLLAAAVVGLAIELRAAQSEPVAAAPETGWMSVPQAVRQACAHGQPMVSRNTFADASSRWRVMTGGRVPYAVTSGVLDDGTQFEVRCKTTGTFEFFGDAYGERRGGVWARLCRRPGIRCVR